MVDNVFARYARRAAKGAWWLATPWRMPQRVAFLRDRAAMETQADELAVLAAQERSRAELRASGAELPAPAVLDLFDDTELAQGADVPVDRVACPPCAPDEITDASSAARFCIDLWRRRADLRQRFPDGPAGGAKGAWGDWVLHAGAAELGLDAAALAHVASVLASDFSACARQAFLGSAALRAVLPHGLTPVGMPALFRWFMRTGLRQTGLPLEQLWWLLLEAAHDPARELRLAHAFTPAWQALHPDGGTLFGRDDLATRFAAEYGATGAWLDARHWPEPGVAPAEQIRTSYQVRESWRAAHPRALDDAQAAQSLVAWLASPKAGLPKHVRAWCAALDAQAVAEALVQPGVNVIGHFCYPSGLRVSVESMVHAMESVGLCASLRDVRTDAKDDPHHVDFRGMESHVITIIHTQPEPFFDDAYARADLFERTPRTYRIAYWYWEFDSVPESWSVQARQVDEIWAATEFVAHGLRERFSLPVRTLFPGVKLAPFERRERTHFGLDPSRYTFLFTFHMMSVMERKNPLGLIRAFKAAFRPDEAVCLVLKTSFGERHPQQLQELHDAAAGANIQVINAVYSPDEVLSLMEACDAYVSLHRSEGLGLTMAEAMLMGKPVIATGFSGNVDFMDESNSLLVRHELVKLGRDIPPYHADLEWAEPSTEHAAELMRRVFDDQEAARALGARAKASAEANLSIEAAGRRIARRLAEIRG
ncbi:glycosyltransferase [Variovorax sp. dw_954]|uniref:glycosyltransferase n=1 Tax=Variovorax sp. dw_954 TaxID=2720078 RepID=UPI002115E9BF|nr:glycosyltransferase [Variovorax sp. dw_954]